MEVCTINLGSMLTRTSNKFPGRRALISHEGRELSYEQFEHFSNCFANALLKLGIKKGDHVAVLSTNCNEELIAFFGIVKIGAIVVPINVRLADEELKWIINHSDAKALIFEERFAGRIEAIRDELEAIGTYICIGRDKEENVVDFIEIIERSESHPPKDIVHGDDTAFMLYTAGTTGRPKGVLITHNGLIWNCVNWVYAGTYRESDLSLHVFPLYHVAALCSVLTYIFIGGTMYLKRTFDPSDCLETIEREKITRWAAAPTVFNMLLELPEAHKYNTSSLTMVGSGAAIMPVETQRGLRALFPNAQIFDTYGMTEASGGITTLPPEYFGRKVGSVGKAHITVEVKVVNDSDEPVPQGEIGEIIFRGNNLMKGYYKDPEATAEALKGGWMHTGDLGRLDDEGFLYIVDRKKDMIVTGGENVYPREVEDVLFSHPQIGEAAVIGVPDPKWGEAVVAAVVPKEGAIISEEEIIDYCHKRIAGFKCPKSVNFLESLPKNPAGKILKRELREKFRDLRTKPS